MRGGPLQPQAPRPPLGEFAAWSSIGVFLSQFGEVLFGIEEFGFAALDFSNPIADLHAPLGAELDWLLGQSKGFFQDLLSAGCHVQSLSQSP